VFDLFNYVYRYRSGEAEVDLFLEKPVYLVGLVNDWLVVAADEKARPLQGPFCAYYASCRLR
jgi:hypothetical protein